MKVRIIVFIAVSCMLMACKEDRRQNVDENLIEKDTVPVQDSDSLTGDYEGENTVKLTTPDILTGVFIHTNAENDNCACNCVTVDFQNPTKLCLDKKSGLSIMARFKRMPDGSLGIYYEQAKNQEGITDKNIPWDKFDKSIPIATISYTSNNAFNLNWIGFTIDGELALDYAIYGKKNLEGSYRIK